jgi:ribonuclease Z
VDCLYHEATFMEDEKIRSKQTEHSTARQAGEIALKAGVKKLIIGHYSARYTNQTDLLNEAKAVFENTVLGEDLTTYEI